MATLLDALSDGSYDLQNKRDLSGDFSKKLLNYRNVVVSEFLKYNIDLSKAIAKIAQRDNLNDDQIQRIVEEVNNQVYLVKYDQLKGKPDREVEFDLASKDKIKKIMKGETVSDSKPETDLNGNVESKGTSKTAFETEKFESMEKVASAESYDLFNGMMSHSYGDLSIATRKTRDEFMMTKIASHIKEKETELNKIAKSLKNTANELGDAFVNLERLGSDTSEVLSAIIKHANLNEKEVELVKEATADRINLLVERRYLPENFTVNLNDINLEKKASEKFTLGKFSLNKVASVACDTNIPRICLSTNKVVNGIEDIVKIAEEMKGYADELRVKNDEYISMREKCAEQGISSDTIENAGFFM